MRCGVCATTRTLRMSAESSSRRGGETAGRSCTSSTTRPRQDVAGTRITWACAQARCDACGRAASTRPSTRPHRHRPRQRLHDLRAPGVVFCGLTTTTASTTTRMSANFGFDWLVAEGCAMPARRPRPAVRGGSVHDAPPPTSFDSAQFHGSALAPDRSAGLARAVRRDRRSQRPRAVRDTELGQDVGDVDAHGLGTDEQSGSDLAVRLAFSDQPQHVDLLVRQRRSRSPPASVTLPVTARAGSRARRTRLDLTGKRCRFAAVRNRPASASASAAASRSCCSTRENLNRSNVGPTGTAAGNLPSLHGEAAHARTADWLSSDRAPRPRPDHRAVGRVRRRGDRHDSSTDDGGGTTRRS